MSHIVHMHALSRDSLDSLARSIAFPIVDENLCTQAWAARGLSVLSDIAVLQGVASRSNRCSAGIDKLTGPPRLGDTALTIAVALKPRVLLDDRVVEDRVASFDAADERVLLLDTY